jgi:ribose transport system ATP-binding protein
MSILLRMQGISKSFGRQRVLRAVDFELRRGEVHVLAGENGAGKSTLIKILGGVHQPDEGGIEIDGCACRFVGPRAATAHGVAVIHQELSLIPFLSIADNIFLGREPTRAGWRDVRRTRAAAARFCGRLGLVQDVRMPVARLPLGVRQMVEIAKALAAEASIIVMDEPTSALSESEAERLFACVGDLKHGGRGIVYITHRLEEVYQLADCITVLRDGSRVAHAAAKDLPPEALVGHMVGRNLPVAAIVEPSACSGAPRLVVRNLSVTAPVRSLPPLVERVSLEVRAGEIVGLAGLQGSGNSTLLEAIFGALGPRMRGMIELDGRALVRPTPRKAIARGLALLTHDRQNSGLVPQLGVGANTTLAALARLGLGPLRRPGREREAARSAVRTLGVRAQSLHQPVGQLSGGNQQKVLLAKWLLTQPRVLLLDEPTRGVDVGAKEEIYALLAAWRAGGYAILLTTSELPELLRLSDRVIVLHRGRVTAEFTRATARREAILHAAMGAA